MDNNGTLTGYPCPHCGTPSIVYCTRRQDTVRGSSIKRYRKCNRCNKNFLTVELLVVQDSE